MTKKLSKLLSAKAVRNKRGATMVEYAIMLMSIAAVCIAVVGVVGSETIELFQVVRW